MTSRRVLCASAAILLSAGMQTVLAVVAPDTDLGPGFRSTALLSLVVAVAALASVHRAIMPTASRRRAWVGAGCAVAALTVAGAVSDIAVLVGVPLLAIVLPWAAERPARVRTARAVVAVGVALLITVLDVMAAFLLGLLLPATVAAFSSWLVLGGSAAAMLLAGRRAMRPVAGASRRDRAGAGRAVRTRPDL